MKAEEYWKMKYDEAGELIGFSWSDIIKFNADTIESYARLMIEKDRERVKELVWDIAHSAIDEVPIILT